MICIKFLKLFTIVCFLLTPFIISAQTGDSLTAQLSRKWQNAKTYALKMAELMPEEYYNFKPVPEEMSFREQLLHIAQNMQWLSTSYLFQDKNKIEKGDNAKDKAAVMKVLSDSYDMGLAAHKSISEKQLDKTVDFFAVPMTRRQILLLMHDHQSHHLGQIIVYLRLKGIKPPDYIGW